MKGFWEPSQVKIFSIPEGDWEALYVNGELELEQHNIRIRDIKDFAPIGSIEEFYVSNFDFDDGDYFGDCFPETIEKFPEHWIIETND